MAVRKTTRAQRAKPEKAAPEQPPVDATSLWRTPEENRQIRGAKRDAILRAAIDLFNEKGFTSASLDDVAGRLGVTKPTIYHYFKTKEDILVEGLRLGMDVLQAALTEANGRGSGFDRLRRYLYQYAQQSMTPYGKCVNQTADYELSEPNRAEFRALKRAVDHGMRDIIREGIDDGSIADVDPKLAAFAISGALNSISKWYNPRGEFSGGTLAVEFVDLILSGLKPQGGRSRGSSSPRSKA